MSILENPISSLSDSDFQSLREIVATIPPKPTKEETDNLGSGYFFAEISGTNIETESGFDSTRLVVCRDPIIYNGKKVYKCAVSWFNSNDSSMLSRALQFNVNCRERMYNYVLAEFDLEKMQADENYRNEVIKKLFDYERIQSYMNMAREENLNRPCGQYIGGLIIESGNYSEIFSEEIGEASHNSYYVEQIRNQAWYGRNNSKKPVDKAYFTKNIQGLSQAGISGLTPCTDGAIELDGGLTAYTKIGDRDNQEDAVALFKKRGLKMMVVSDGIGGEAKGELASHVVIQRLGEWFSKLSDEDAGSYSTDVHKIRDILVSKIRGISAEISAHESKCGATLVCAIIGENNTIVANVGDSRACILKDNKIKQISKDDSDENTKSLTSWMGKRLVYANCVILENSSYDMLLLFTDGVTNCLSEEEIAVICRNDRGHVIEELVGAALKKATGIPHDNTSGALYIPREENEK